MVDGPGTVNALRGWWSARSLPDPCGTPRRPPNGSRPPYAPAVHRLRCRSSGRALSSPSRPTIVGECSGRRPTPHDAGEEPPGDSTVDEGGPVKDRQVRAEVDAVDVRLVESHLMVLVEVAPLDQHELGVAGEARPHVVAAPPSTRLGDVVCEERAWADEAHGPAEKMDDLG